jgi:AAA+ superfamily predicted ATPase
MTISGTQSPKNKNIQGLLCLITRIKHLLQAYITSELSSDVNKSELQSPPSITAKQQSETANDLSAYYFEELGNLFRLSPFERDILLLCLGMELDPEFEFLCAKAHLNPERSYPTLGLALSILPEPDFNVLSQDNTLQYWNLIEIGTGFALTQAPIRLDKRILGYLLGNNSLDEQLLGIVSPVSAELQHIPLTASYKNLIEEITFFWNNVHINLPVLQLCGSELTTKYQIAAEVSQRFNRQIKIISATAIPSNLNQSYQLKQCWEREAILTGNVLLLDCDHISRSDPSQLISINQFIENFYYPLIISSQTRINTEKRTIVSFDIPSLSYQEQRTLWQTHLGSATKELNGQVVTLASQFNLNAATIKTACLQLNNRNSLDTSTSISQKLWNFCRIQARPKLEDLAQRIETDAGWDDLILPDLEKTTLQEITAHLRQRAKVYEEWGFAGKERRGLGITALFSGQSGTGKTMAAGVLANTLNLDLYRIDLSAVVSKYIGETEKNLRKIFDAAETGGAILLFDEADALFGKRTEVKDSHDRHANVEVSYLLQRMEAYQGLAILTTNLKTALDKAFMRRIRFVIPFPFPDAKARAKIWQRIFPTQTPTQNLDFRKLSYLSVPGGNIRNIALNAAMLAADANEPVQMKHILQTAKSECLKLEKPLADSEVRNWIVNE